MHWPFKALCLHILCIIGPVHQIELFTFFFQCTGPFSHLARAKHASRGVMFRKLELPVQLADFPMLRHPQNRRRVESQRIQLCAPSRSEYSADFGWQFITSAGVWFWRLGTSSPWCSRKPAEERSQGNPTYAYGHGSKPRTPSEHPNPH